MTQSQHTPLAIVFALGFTMMLGPFAIDTYLPAFPIMAEALGVDIRQVSLSISVYMFAFAIGQLIGGALSDKFGRRRVLISGLLLFAGASFLLAEVESLEWLLLGRMLQAIGGGWTGVSIPALVRDRVQGQQAAKLFSMIGLVAIIAPAIAPAIGNLLLQFGGWGLIFQFLGVYALCMLPLLAVTVFRSPRRPPPQRGAMTIMARYLEVLRERRALPHIGWQTAGFGGLIIFVTWSAYIYQVHYEQSPRAFTLLFACNIITMFACNLLNRFLLNRMPSLQILRGATQVQALAAAWLLAVALFDGPVLAFLPGMMLYAGTLGAISPNNQACFLEYFPSSSGSAAALMGTATFGLGGLASGLTTLLPPSLLTVTLCMMACALASLAFMALRGRESDAALEASGAT
ncbi:Bcr/CflA family efflux MFS transporter [Chromatocurvus halotolerans]|uniref:Bcr/CflA family efflux transporter n=1 Tax=Chromatocurvus halotolerans TaxID=1132028 RepID=A0A4R2KR91_9GAMM|nr:Bcr/CflA family efflux MFS transporter [Chromatocurvus halotolerans]TCO76273.1 DHA1 family bicyclomycin/chloramphenicol resistance-like MFS transporter [Chromatocurvus halotolerans]